MTMMMNASYLAKISRKADEIAHECERCGAPGPLVLFLGFYFLEFGQGSIQLQTNHENPFSEGDVVQLQFSGNIRRISALTKGVRWCKKESGTFKPISLQDSPIMTLVPSGQDGCTQFSLIFYHITQNDTDLEIMCDMKSSIYDTECREYSNTPKILINTSIETKGNEWRLSPIIIYDKDGIINSHNFTMQGSGKTIQLLCMASTFSATKLAVLNWCVRKNDQVIWNKIVLQEEEISFWKQFRRISKIQQDNLPYKTI
ncbi:uncharacterized protein LOC134246766 [Saccostrea cucullata]|uniref:uncharacterized protein LOC134246766 n=1 Tax=Saccostrea cuccullata TaxID=36930 RepID=UPI002ED09C6E